MIDEETGSTTAKDKAKAVIGGIITEKKVKYTKNNQIMAFITIEDLVGSVEVIVFPQAYEKNSAKIVEDNKVFVEGRVSLEEEREGKLICENVTLFDEMPRNLWIKFPNMKSYVDNEKKLFGAIHDFEGRDTVTIYIEETRQKKTLPPNKNVKAQGQLLENLCSIFGEKNIKLV
jgi:DNA polymerase-3 subunit alpha